MTDQIGVRELRQHASRWLERVEAGESFEVTSNGRPIARLVPIEIGESVLEQMVRTGQATRGTGDMGDLPDPVPPKLGVPLPSEILEEMRRDER